MTFLPSPPLDQNFSADELAIVRRAYARQMLALLGVEDGRIEAAFAAVPRERFLGDPPWTILSPFGGYRSLASADPVVTYQDILFALDPARGVNNGSPSLHAKLFQALAVKAGDRIVHVGAGTGYYSAILSELVGPTGQVTAIEFDATLADQAARALADRPNVTVICGDGAAWPQAPANGVYVNFGVIRPADRWIENLAPGGRLVFWLGGPGPQREGMGGRHSNGGAALAVERQPKGYAVHPVSTAHFVCAEGDLAVGDEAEAEALAKAFSDGGLDKVRSLIWKRPAVPDRCWFAGADWALSTDEIAD
ncbi:protein-L-isoaspartate O-methyltransferase [Bradyrhizobium sp. Leaf396]|nr:protein-L-isoaspartate O-methyltransferase [Bradyrhizobium sp. Leaf396]